MQQFFCNENALLAWEIEVTSVLPLPCNCFWLNAAVIMLSISKVPDYAALPCRSPLDERRRRYGDSNNRDNVVCFAEVSGPVTPLLSPARWALRRLPRHRFAYVVTRRSCDAGGDAYNSAGRARWCAPWSPANCSPGRDQRSDEVLSNDRLACC